MSEILKVEIPGPSFNELTRRADQNEESADKLAGRLLVAAINNLVADEEFACDLLLFFATSTEKEELRRAAKELNLPFDRKSDKELGRYYSLGSVGDFRVNAVETRMGPLGYGGSASKGLLCKSKAEATVIVQVGMAFGTIPNKQKKGDVLVSTSVIPYDRRDILPDGTVDYGPAMRHLSKESLVKIFTAESERSEPLNRSYQIFVGAILSGGARICNVEYRDQLVAGIPSTEEVIIGGEMEAVGLLSISPADAPDWVVVKGISDFADTERRSIDKNNTASVEREVACYNAATFVLSALLNAAHNR